MYSGVTMSISRRTFLLGAGSGLSILVLSACTTPSPTPGPTPSPSRLGTVPAPSAFLRSNWSDDPFARGATSFLPVGASPRARETLLEPLLDRVFFAGEAVADEPGTIRGAIQSGGDAARRLLEVIGSDERIAVIGAGAAGSEAARQLALRGADVVLIEARDRTGGRIDSRVTDGGVPMELGAWRLADEADDELAGRLSRAGILMLPLLGGTAIAEDGSVAQEPDDPDAAAGVAETLAESIEAARQGPADVSVADAVDAAQLDSDDAAVLRRLLAEFSAVTGAEPSEQSSWYLSQLFGEPTSVADGPMVAMLDDAIGSVEPVLSTVVVGVFYDDDGVSLRLGTGESLKVDRVILTVPLGVLKEQAIEFDPVLPLLHRSALEELSVGHIEVVALEFDEPFWSTEAVLWLHEDDDAAVRMWVNLLPITGQAVILGIVSGDAAIALSELDDDEVLEAAQLGLAVFA